jgi:hypothetical protein
VDIQNAGWLIRRLVKLSPAGEPAALMAAAYVTLRAVALRAENRSLGGARRPGGRRRRRPPGRRRRACSPTKSWRRCARTARWRWWRAPGRSGWRRRGRDRAGRPCPERAGRLRDPASWHAFPGWQTIEPRVGPNGVGAKVEDNLPFVDLEATWIAEPGTSPRWTATDGVTTGARLGWEVYPLDRAANAGAPSLMAIMMYPAARDDRPPRAQGDRVRAVARARARRRGRVRRLDRDEGGAGKALARAQRPAPSRSGAPRKIRGGPRWTATGRDWPTRPGGRLGTVIAGHGRVKRLALLSGCLLLLACSDDGGGANTGQGGQAGGNAGSSGGGRGGTTGGGGTTAAGQHRRWWQPPAVVGNTGSGGQTGGTTGGGGQTGGTSGGGGQVGGSTGSAGAAAAAAARPGWSAAQATRAVAAAPAAAGRGGTTGGGGQAGGHGRLRRWRRTCSQLATDYNRGDAPGGDVQRGIDRRPMHGPWRRPCSRAAAEYVNDKTELDRSSRSGTR